MNATTYQPAERRPLASRDLGFVHRVTAWLIARHVSANAISLSSIGFAAAAAVALAATAWTDGIAVRVLFVVAAVCVQMRLLANLLDGMVAIGSGCPSPVGELYNEVPDRVADTLILTSAGFAVGGTPALGCAAAMLAIFVAYIRALGTAAGAKALFIGPMAKPQRMAAMTAACVYCAGVPAWWPGGAADHGFGALGVALTVIVIGAALTAIRRLHRIAAQLETASAKA